MIEARDKNNKIYFTFDSISQAKKTINSITMHLDFLNIFENWVKKYRENWKAYILYTKNWLKKKPLDIDWVNI